MSYTPFNMQRDLKETLKRLYDLSDENQNIQDYFDAISRETDMLDAIISDLPMR